MAAGDINDALTQIPNVVVVSQGSATAAPGAGYARLEVVNGVLGVRVGAGAWVALLDLATAGQIGGLTEKATPVNGDLVVIEDSAAGGAKKKAQLGNLPGGGTSEPYVCIRDEKAQNTGGGTATSGAWRTRDLNTEHADTAGIASVAGNQITLEAGTYRCSIRCPTMKTNRTQARLQNITDAVTLVVGGSAYTYDSTFGDGSQTDSWVVGRFTLAAQKVLEVQQRVQTTFATIGWGVESNWTTEVYTVAEFWREA